MGAKVATRTKKGESASTPERILDAAVVEFSEHGFAGARMDRIAKRAGCNKQLIYHHYGGKEKLSDMVFGRMLTQQSEKFSDLPDSTLAIIDRLSEMINEKPEGIRLLLWERLSFDRILAEQARREHTCAMTQSFDKVEDEELRPYVVMALVALAAFPTLLPQFAVLGTGNTADSPEFKAQYRKAIEWILTHGLSLQDSNEG